MMEIFIARLKTLIRRFLQGGMFPAYIIFEE